jgi:hypothetical protein
MSGTAWGPGVTEIPDVIGTVRAYRKWETFAGELVSTGRVYKWDTREVAGCKLGHRPPEMGCKCGLWAATDPRSWALRCIHGVLGVIECSGPVIEHERNSVIRAQKATIVAVAVRNPWNAKAIARRHPHVLVFRSRRKMIAAYPPATRPERGRVPVLLLLAAYVPVSAIWAGFGGYDIAVAHGSVLNLVVGSLFLAGAAVRGAWSEVISPWMSVKLIRSR